MEIKPMSYNNYVEEYGGGVPEFTLYSLGYWLQQNADKEGQPHFDKLKGEYQRANN